MSNFLFALSSLLSSLAFSSASVLCPSGCHCPTEEVAQCCLFPPDFPSPVHCHFPGKVQISSNSNSSHRWPVADTCLSKWADLSVKLFPKSWPPPSPKRPCTAQLHRLSISGGSLTSLKSEDFKSLFASQSATLEILIIENTMLERLESGLFDRLALKALTEIHLRHNYHLSNLGFGVSVFLNLPQLVTLNLESNRIERLEFVRWGFPKLKKNSSPSRLTSLSLANNTLTYLGPGTFDLFPFLENLSLANNRLSSLSSDVFEGLTSLKRLDLSGNLLNLLGLQNAYFSFSISLANLNHLDLSMNPLMRNVRGESTEWWLSSGCPPSLSHLYLNHIDVDLGQWVPLLPPIDWARCQRLVKVEIQQVPRLPCLPAGWLRSDVLPTQPELITSASRVCTPPGTKPTASTVTTPASLTNAKHNISHTAPVAPEQLGLRELIISSIVGAVLFILLVFLVVIIFTCRRRHWLYGALNKKTGKPDTVLRSSRNERAVMSTYIPAVDCQLPLVDDEISTATMRQSESRILYDENGVPVCSMVVPEVGHTTAVMLPDGTLAYVPQFTPLSGRVTPSSHTGLLENSLQGSRLLLKHPVMVPFMTSHASLATSQIDFPHHQQRPPSYQHNVGKRSRRHNTHAPTSTLSCKSTSFSSLGGSIHSEMPPPTNAFSASPPPIATVAQLGNSVPQVLSSSSAGSSTEEPSLIVGTGGIATASTTTSTANASPTSQSDNAVV
ncbi:unnamed protein product [Mesocestoides corti]|uniref:LRRCT domain-containing protein n=1 Tax=Mesocestoides corti TaxID=53468 RepID=A0A0R3UHU7_MESCO|nr:unnamed protein product [Mesocestoides corti]